TGNDDVRLPEVDDDVTIGVRGGLMKDLNRLAIEIEILRVREEGIRRHRDERRRWFQIAHHPELCILVRDDVRLVRGVLADLRGEIAGDDRLPGPGHLRIAAGVIRMEMRVDDVANRLFCGRLLSLLAGTRS